MRKCMAVLLAGLLMFVLTGNAMAVEDDVLLTETKNMRAQIQAEKNLEREQRQAEREAERIAKLDKLKEFNDELDQISAYKRERLSLRIEINQAHQEIRHLIITVLENQDKEVLQEAREVRQELEGLSEEIRALHEEFQVNRQGFRESLINDDIPQAQAYVDNMIQISGDINSLIMEKLDILQRIIVILS